MFPKVCHREGWSGTSAIIDIPIQDYLRRGTLYPSWDKLRALAHACSSFSPSYSVNWLKTNMLSIAHEPQAIAGKVKGAPTNLALGTWLMLSMLVLDPSHRHICSNTMLRRAAHVQVVLSQQPTSVTASSISTSNVFLNVTSYHQVRAVDHFLIEHWWWQRFLSPLSIHMSSFGFDLIYFLARG